MANRPKSKYFKNGKEIRHKYVKIGSGDPYAHIEVHTPYVVLGGVEYLWRYYAGILDVDEESQEYYKMRQKALKVFLNNVWEFAMQAAYNELRIIFAESIKEYYSYITKSYIRHGEGVAGTGSGTNLLSADQISISGHGGYTSVDITLSEAAMAGYQKVSTTTVYKDVIEKGRRFVGVSNKKAQYETWDLTYTDAYYTCAETIDITFEKIAGPDWFKFIEPFLLEAIDRL